MYIFFLKPTTREKTDHRRQFTLLTFCLHSHEHVNQEPPPKKLYSFHPGMYTRRQIFIFLLHVCIYTFILNWNICVYIIYHHLATLLLLNCWKQAEKRVSQFREEQNRTLTKTFIHFFITVKRITLLSS